MGWAAITLLGRAQRTTKPAFSIPIPSRSVVTDSLGNTLPLLLVYETQRSAPAEREHHRGSVLFCHLFANLGCRIR